MCSSAYVQRSMCAYACALIVCAALSACALVLARACLWRVLLLEGMRACVMDASAHTDMLIGNP